MRPDLPLVSLSAITSIWEKFNQDYVDNFVPLLATYLLTSSQSSFSMDDIPTMVDGFQNQFGIRVPHYPMVTIAKKAARYGVLHRQTGRYRLNASAAAEYDIRKDLSSFERDQTHLTQSLVEFAHDRYDLDLSADEANGILLAFVRNNDIEMLFASHDIDSTLHEPHLPHKYRRSMHLVHSFYINAWTSAPDEFEILTRICMGNILCNAILIPSRVAKTETVKNTTFYIDTPILLALLGADGPQRTGVVTQLLQDIRDNGGALRVFEHTYQETREALDASKQWVESPQFDVSRANRTTIYFRQEGYKESDVLRLISHLPEVLNEASIETVDVPSHAEFKSRQIDEDALTRIIVEMATPIDHFLANKIDHSGHNVPVVIPA